MKARSLLSLAVLAGGAVLALGQGLNVDVDLYGSSSEVGSGAPSSDFGGSASQPGFWNAYPINYNDNFSLVNTDGNYTGVVIRTNQTGGGGGGWHNTSNQGNWALLLNDAQNAGPNEQYSLAGLENGRYLVLCYVVDPSGEFGQADVIIPESLTHNPQHAEGTMPGNRSIQGVSHTIHEIQVTTGSFEIQMSGPGNQSHTFFNGFQVVPEAVPEPATFLLLAPLTAFLLLRLRSPR